MLQRKRLAQEVILHPKLLLMLLELTLVQTVLTPTPLQIGPSEKEVEGWSKGSGSSHLDVSKYYPFGMEGIYISVQNCLQAPPKYVYSPMVIEHVRNLFKEFVMNPKDCSTKADLMPFDPKTNMPLTSVDKANVHSYWHIGSYQGNIQSKLLSTCKSIQIHLYGI